jgi:hypothetical protein
MGSIYIDTASNSQLMGRVGASWGILSTVRIPQIKKVSKRLALKTFLLWAHLGSNQGPPDYETS